MAGLIKAVTDAALLHYGYTRSGPNAPEGPDDTPPPVPGPENLYTVWSRRASPSLGLPPHKDQRQLLHSYRSWVYSCVRAISFRVASLPLDLVLYDSGDSTADVKQTTLLDHPFLDMMWRPNPFTSRLELWLTTLNHLDLSGNAYWLVLCDKMGIPREIWPLYPQYMRPIPHPTNMLAGYVYWTQASPPIRFELDNPEYRIVHFKYPNPMNPYFGMGPLEAQAYAYDLDLYTEVYQRNFFQHGARPDFFLETEQKIDKTTAAWTLELWDEHHKGPANMWKPAILGHGMKAHTLNINNRDMQFALLAEYSMEKIIAAYGVPKAKLGLVADANRANAEAADLTFNSEAIMPRLMLIEERIENDILPLYPGQSKRLWLGADFENPVPADREAERADRELELKYGVTFINEDRVERGKNPVAWGSVPILPSTMSPLGSAPPPGASPAPEPAPAPTPPETPPEEEPTPGETEAMRTSLWESFIARTLPQEEAMAAPIIRHMKQQEREVLDRLETRGKALLAYFGGWSAKKVRAHLQRDPALVDAVLFTVGDEAPKLLELIKGHIRDAVDAAGLAAVAEVGVGVWDLQDPAVLTWLEAHGLQAARGITETTRELLRETLIEGVAAGEGTEDLVLRIKAIYDNATTARVRNIARTEVNTASTWGTLQGYQQSGVVEESEWLSARDERVRETHRKADGQRAPLGGNFHVGAGHGPGPGHIGLAEEDCNCRCTLIAVLKGKSARQGAVARLLERALAALAA